ncbi:hypothetical protein M011DRAFT_467469 [Sporormia fimetaria CBS 119925]|uniref:Regulator of phospholipase D SRF1 n=1 Tax=Sporormia fimetaria CBS 119925 TaxID=1340428 RepID=A0A6A6VDP1_9PLEO|nr:hypothetical protein M011DRAFT_467469 [Sporormia fimetaria CBS 119925]
MASASPADHSSHGTHTTQTTTHPQRINNQSLLLPSALPRPTTAASSTSPPPRPPSGLSAASSSAKSNHDRVLDSHLDGSAVRKSHSQSVSSNPYTLASSKGSLSPDNRERQRAVRTLPPWVQSAEEDDNADPTSSLLPRTPTSARAASHNYMPTPKQHPKPKPNAVPGRQFDHVREGTPVTIRTPLAENASKWRQFAKASDYDYARPPSSRGQIVDDEWMKENMPDLEAPWEPLDKENEPEGGGHWLFNASKRRRRIAKAHRLLMNHPMVPALIRLIVFTFSTLALGLAGSIFNQSKHAGCDNSSSTWLALIVDCVAIVYTVYITYDEYTSKPLGLRSHNAKMRLIFLDLLFIVFDSANLSLAFQALTDPRWACRDSGQPDTQHCPFDDAICQRQKALTATLLIALVAWLCTFAISTLRLIERVAR